MRDHKAPWRLILALRQTLQVHVVIDELAAAALGKADQRKGQASLLLEAQRVPGAGRRTGDRKACAAGRVLHRQVPCAAGIERQIGVVQILSDWRTAFLCDLAPGGVGEPAGCRSLEQLETEPTVARAPDDEHERAEFLRCRSLAAEIHDSVMTVPVGRSRQREVEGRIHPLLVGDLDVMPRRERNLGPRAIVLPGACMRSMLPEPGPANSESQVLSAVQLGSQN